MGIAMNGLIVAGSVLTGGFIGWWAGLFLCPDWGDIGINAASWAIGGAAVGMIVGGGTAGALL